MPNLNSFPATLKSFSFKREIHPEQPHRRFALAEYVNQEGITAIAKRLNGSRFSLNYFRLNNEIRFYETRAKLSATQNAELQKQWPHISTPRYIATIHSRGGKILLIEKITGQPITTLPIEKQVELYEEILGFIPALGSMVTLSMRLLTCTPIYQIISMPIIVFRALLLSPSLWKTILSMTRSFVLALPQLLRDRRTLFVHRDLLPNNILVNSTGHISIIDFDVLGKMHPYIELGKLSLGLWERDAVREAWLTSTTMRSIPLTGSHRMVFQALGYYLVVFELGLPHANKKALFAYASFLSNRSFVATPAHEYISHISQNV